MTYGCFNRPPLVATVVVQTGWKYDTANAKALSRTSIHEVIPNPNSKDCQYSKTTPDPGCTGCASRAAG